MKIFIHISILLATTLLFLSCGRGKTNRQLFEENLDKYVEACIPTFVEKGADTVSARGFCRCIMEKAYTIDSSLFVREFSIENRAYAEELLDKHSDEFFNECGPLIQQFLPKERVAELDSGE